MPSFRFVHFVELVMGSSPATERKKKLPDIFPLTSSLIGRQSRVEAKAPPRLIRYVAMP